MTRTVPHARRRAASWLLTGALTLLGTVSAAHAQGTQAAPGPPTLEIYGFGQADLIADFKQTNPDWYDVVRPSRLPSFPKQYGEDGRFHMSVRQSRLGARGSLGDVRATFEFDMFGVGGDAGQTTIRLRHAYGQWKQIGAGQTNSQFMDIEAVFVEVKRVLQPGGVFVFVEEPIRRMLSLRLYRCPYYDTMKPWERKLFDWGLLGFLVKDVIGAHQEESFGIRQNHRMGLRDWHLLVEKHFVAHEYEIFVARRGWGERDCRALMALQEERAGVAARVSAERLQDALKD